VWLEKNQAQDGSWNVALEGGSAEYRVGVTGLAILSFLSEGSHNLGGRFKDTVARGINYLIDKQNASGLFGGTDGHYMYNHGLSTLAVAECFLLSQDESQRGPLTKAVNFIISNQKSDGGWGYKIDADNNDTTVICFQVMALRTAHLAGIRDAAIPQALSKARRRILELTDDEGKVGYNRLDSNKKAVYSQELGYHTLTAMGAFAYVMSSVNVNWEVINLYRKTILTNEMPVHADKKKNDFMFPFFASLVLYQVQDPSFDEWFQHVVGKLLKMQSSDGSWSGSLDRWFSHGGRVYSTAVIILIIQSPNRYPRLIV
jgi:prenyltransferase beta subunit